MVSGDTVKQVWTCRPALLSHAGPNRTQPGSSRYGSKEVDATSVVWTCCSTFQAVFIQLLYLKLFYAYIYDGLEWRAISFIEMYRERSFLWDPIDSLYKNRYKRHDKHMKIAVSFGIGKCYVKKKSVKCDTTQNNFNTDNQ